MRNNYNGNVLINTFNHGISETLAILYLHIYLSYKTFIFWQKAKVGFTEQLQELWEYNTTKPFCVCYFKGKKLLMIRKSFYLFSTHLAAALFTVLGVVIITNANAISLLYTIRVVLCSLPW